MLLFAADDISRRHFQMHFCLGALRVKHSWGRFDLGSVSVIIAKDIVVFTKAYRHADRQADFFFYFKVTQPHKTAPNNKPVHIFTRVIHYHLCI